MATAAVLRRRHHRAESEENIVPVPAELRDRLQQVSRETGSSANSLILLAIDQLLGRMEQPEESSVPAPKDKAAS